MKKAYLVRVALLSSIMLLTNVLDIFSQLPVVNSGRAVYARVENHWSQFSNNSDTVLVDNASGFSIGDTVLFHHTISGYPYATTELKGDIFVIKNAGIYAIYLIDTIDGNKIALNNSLPPFGSNAHLNGDYGQLIKIPTYERARVAAGFDFPAWDPVTKKGGIFPLIINKKLVLEADMSATGKGFKGGQANGDYVSSGGVCSEGVFSPDLNYFTTSAVDSGAFKGGTFSNSLVNLVGLTRGRGRIGTGGGGGNALFSGGGGGSNRGRGGQGGRESNSCGVPGDMGGIGGQAITYETDPMAIYGNRIHMGGGGGAGTQSPSGSRNGTSGGNGGGIFIIITDTLETVGTRTISANGSSVSTVATAGAGGGGGGGVIVMEASNYIGNLVLQVRGGNGGNITASPDITGPGGGGGGGVIQHNGASLPANVDPQRNNGVAGVVGVSTNTNSAMNGDVGVRQGNLLIPIRGFILNTIPDDRTICEDQLPPVLNAPKARGGSGNFTYTWLQSSDAVNWSPAPGVNNQQVYQPPMLGDTTFFRRYVVDNVNPALNDSGYYMAVNVHPKIQNNLIIADDTICFNLAPEDNLTSILSLSGGDGNGYTFTWEKSSDNSSFSAADGVNNLAEYDVPALSGTRWFRRKVNSGVCISNSNSVKITVLPQLGNLSISEDQIICNNQNANVINGGVPTGGQTGDIRYEWWRTSGSFRNMVATSEDYQPLSLPAGTYQYVRKVYSGSENACTDSSNSVTILVYPDITGNSVSSPKDTICAGLPTLTLGGSLPGGGKTGSYSYYWEKSPDGTGSWTVGGLNPGLKDLQPGTLNSTSYFRRTVYSANSDSACSHVSNVIKIQVLPELINNLASSDDTICQFTEAPVVTGLAAGGGTGTGYTYLWEFRKDDTNWATAPGISDQINYSPGVLTDTSYYYFRRIVKSGPENTCTNTGNPVFIFIQPSIKDNDYSQPGGLEICLGSPALIAASSISGGDGSAIYTWQDSTVSGNWQNAPGINSNRDYTNDMLLTPTWYRRIAVSGKCSDTGNPVLADTLSLPVILNMTSSYDTICNDQTDYYLKLEIFSEEGNPADYNLIYNDGINSDQSGILQANTDSLNITGFNPFTAYEYTIVSLTDVNGCKAVQGLGHTLDLWVNKAPEPEIIKLEDPYNICGPLFQLSSQPDLNPGVSPGWWSSIQDISITDSLAVDGEFQLIYQDFDSLFFKVRYSQQTSSCGVRSDSIEIRLFEQPEKPEILEGDTAIIFLADELILTAETPTAGFVQWEVTESDAEIEGSGLNVILKDIPLKPETIVTFKVRNGNCTVVSDEILVIRKEVHVFEGISPENADNLNDFLVAEGLQVDGLTFNFQLFSTNGMLVRELDQDDLDRLGFESNLPNNGRVLWDGKTKNESDYVPSGTYYYVLVINFKGREFVDKGFVVVK